MRFDSSFGDTRVRPSGGRKSCASRATDINRVVNDALTVRRSLCIIRIKRKIMLTQPDKVM